MVPSTTLVTVVLSFTSTSIAPTNVPSSMESNPIELLHGLKSSRAVPVVASPSIHPSIMRHNRTNANFFNLKPIIEAPLSDPFLLPSYPTHADEQVTASASEEIHVLSTSSTQTHHNKSAITPASTSTGTNTSTSSHVPFTNLIAKFRAKFIPNGAPMWHGPYTSKTAPPLPIPDLSRNSTLRSFNHDKNPGAPHASLSQPPYPIPPPDLQPRNPALGNVPDTWTIIAGFDNADTACARNFSAYNLLSVGQCFPLALYPHDVLGVRWGTGVNAPPCGLRLFKNGLCSGERAVIGDWMPEPGQPRECRSMEKFGGRWGSVLVPRCCSEEGKGNGTSC